LLSFVTGIYRVFNAVTNVIPKDLLLQSTKCRTDCRDLRDNIDAVTVFLDHAREPTHWASSSGWISESAVGWIVGICIFLFFLFGAIGTFALPFVWYKQGEARRRVLNLLSSSYLAAYPQPHRPGRRWSRP
jgi:hypothetical protein